MTRGFRTSCARYYLSLVGFVTNRKSTWSPSREDEICFLSTRIPRSVNRVQFGMCESIKRKTAANWLVMRQKTTFQCFLCCFSFSDCPRLNQSALNICLCFCSIYTRFDFRRSFIFFSGSPKCHVDWTLYIHTRDETLTCDRVLQRCLDYGWYVCCENHQGTACPAKIKRNAKLVAKATRSQP